MTTLEELTTKHSDKYDIMEFSKQCIIIQSSKSMSISKALLHSGEQDALVDEEGNMATLSFPAESTLWRRYTAFSKRALSLFRNATVVSKGVGATNNCRPIMLLQFNLWIAIEGSVWITGR
jgi:fatty acid/phospholipid biosynthesis enzyme